MNSQQQAALLQSRHHEFNASQVPKPLHADGASIFQSTARSFREALSEEDKLHLTGIEDASDMMKDLIARCTKAKESSKLLIACKSIDKFAQRWQSFFDVVGIFVSSNPEWSALAWGALRLVFLLSSNYVSFFEKLAGMLAKITERLPSYHDHLLRFRECCPDIMKERSGQALSLVYKDILQFCQEACKIFMKKSGGERNKMSVIRDLFWTPFDVRFHLLLERLRDHQELFELEVKVENEKALKRFTDKAERLIDQADEVITQQKRLMDTPLNRVRLEEESTTRYRARMRDIKNWLDSSDFATDFEKAGRARNPGSCAWIVEDIAYKAWKLRGEAETDTTQAPSILWLEGKPGFGKTTLSVSIIEDLRSNGDGDGEGDTTAHDTEAVVYFYFDLQRPDKRRFSDVLRATITQLIHRYQEDCVVIDAISLLMDLKGSGQLKASPRELAEMFLLFLSRLSLVTLVLDGIDECENFAESLPFLTEASLKRNFRSLFLGRPSVQTPEKYSPWIYRHPLQNSNNSDIRDYLFLKATELQESGDVDEGLNPTYVADLLTPRANSMFLWANLMFSYLQSPALSPAERRVEIEVTSRLEEMDELYCQLLQQLSARFKKERALLAKIFQFLATSDQPPTLQQLRVAVAIKPGQKLSESDYIARFPDALRKLCGALIEIQADNTVQLIHLSLREFLLSDEALRLDAPFRVEPRAASLFLSTTFLSYLVHEIPQGPLSGSPDTLADCKDLDKALSLLRFAAQSWVTHASRAIRPTSGGSESLSDLISTCQPLIQQIVAFLSHKTSISAWIETCWTYEFSPSIEVLWTQLKANLHQPGINPEPSPIEVQISGLITRIQVLSEYLIKLQADWGHLLSLRPYEIWAPSISAFMGSRSWAHNDEAKVTTIESEELHEGNNTIIAISKLSDCGRFIGIVKIYCPPNARGSKILNECECGMSKCGCACNTSVVDLQDAFARYQVIGITASFPSVVDFHIELDPEDLPSIERNAEGESFRFPIALASDLTQVAILHTVYRIGRAQSLLKQKIDIFPVSYVLDPGIANFAGNPIWHRADKDFDAPPITAKDLEDMNSEELSIFFMFTCFDDEVVKDMALRLRRSSNPPQQLHPEWLVVSRAPRAADPSAAGARPAAGAAGALVGEGGREEPAARDRLDRLRSRRPESLIAESAEKEPQNIHMKDPDPLEQIADARFYRLEFSPCGNFLAVAKRNRDSNDHPEGFWSITIWRRETAIIRSQETLFWQVMTEISCLHGNFLDEGSFAFNPLYTLFVMMETGYSRYSCHYRTIICDFGKDTSGKPITQMVYGSHLRNIHFSPCGRYLFGDHGWFDTLRTIDISEHVNGAISVPSPSPHGTFDSTPLKNQLFPINNSLLQGTKPPAHSTNKLTLRSSNGAPELCIVRKYSDGAVVRKRLDSQIEEEETLLYLPNIIHANSSLSVLDDPQENQDQIRMVLLNNPRDSYIWNSLSNVNLPAMITRSVKSIHEYRLPLRKNNVTYEPNELSSVPNAKGLKLLEYVASSS